MNEYFVTAHFLIWSIFTFPTDLPTNYLQNLQTRWLRLQFGVKLPVWESTLISAECRVPNKCSSIPKSAWYFQAFQHNSAENPTKSKFLMSPGFSGYLKANNCHIPTQLDESDVFMFTSISFRCLQQLQHGQRTPNFGEPWSSSNTMWLWPDQAPRTKWHVNLSRRLATIHLCD